MKGPTASGRLRVGYLAGNDGGRDRPVHGGVGGIGGPQHAVSLQGTLYQVWTFFVWNKGHWQAWGSWQNRCIHTSCGAVVL